MDLPSSSLLRLDNSSSTAMAGVVVIRTRLHWGGGEHVTGIEARYGEKDDHTRIKYIKLSTNTIEGGDLSKAMKGVGTDYARRATNLVDSLAQVERKLTR
ncbi:unnamed protein product [Phytophthora lilii]|uniref:Unnamed protein product n=1 Tax=Phytophthora lilii TaxID=2077276 RepID=A0A9W6WQI3_9STRA|nr:unnamed protein product [Phytophthora lilii]